MFWPVLSALSALFLVKRVLGFLNARKVSKGSLEHVWLLTTMNACLVCPFQEYPGLPQVEGLFEPVSLIGGLLPTSSWNLGLKFPFVQRKTCEFISHFDPRNRLCHRDLEENLLNPCRRQ